MAEHVCPVWIGYLLASPLRKLLQNPRRMLSPYVNDGMKVLDVGSAMGFFSLPLAEMVGVQGKVICVDLQEKMLGALRKRAEKAGLINRIETHQCTGQSLGLNGLKENIDFAIAFAVVHEVPDPANLFFEIFRTLKPSARFLFSEPKTHVSLPDFNKSVSIAEKNGFKVIERPHIARSHSVILEKKN